MNDTEGAELVAAFLDRQKFGDAARRADLGQVVEFGLDGKVGVEHATPGARGARDHRRQTVIGLRPEHDLDAGCAAQDPVSGDQPTTRARGYLAEAQYGSGAGL